MILLLVNFFLSVAEIVPCENAKHEKFPSHLRSEFGELAKYFSAPLRTGTSMNRLNGHKIKGL